MKPLITRLASQAGSVLAVLLLGSTSAVLAHDSGDADLSSTSDVQTSSSESSTIETTVTARKPITAASSLTVRERDFNLRPHPRPADILQVTPGLYIAQHAGGGKANQYFLRGFDADHGTDVAIFVDGIPINLVSHGHGQGFADLHFLITEMVDRVEVTKGPYFAQYGDFGTAGAINLITKNATDSRATLEAGSFKTARGFGVVSGKDSAWKPLIAAQVHRSSGPFLQTENLHRYHLFSKVTRDFTPSTSLSLGYTGYNGSWYASGQIPAREVDAGRLDRFGSIDPTEGGESFRHMVFAQFKTRPGFQDELQLSTYVSRYKLSLFSNFTFFSRDPLYGDQIQQRDLRTYGGVNGSYRLIRGESGGTTFDTLVGFQSRYDVIENSLTNTQGRVPLSPVLDNRIRERALGLYAQEEVTWNSWLRTVIGLRGDSFGFSNQDHVDPGLSGDRTANVLSPKANAIFNVTPQTELFLNYGWGFHSNDARGVTRPTDAVTPLTRAVSYEVGSRTRLLGDRLDLAGSLFLLDLDSELVFVGDEGTTEASGRTRRTGVEFEARYQLASWLFADLDATFVRARYREDAGGGTAVPLAPNRIIGGGLSARHPKGYFGRLGFFNIADRPASEDRFFTAQGFTRLDASLGYRIRSVEFSLAVQNLLNAKIREAQFANVSRLPSETSAASCPAGTRAHEDDAGTFDGCEDVHFTSGAPINVLASASYFF